MYALIQFYVYSVCIDSPDVYFIFLVNCQSIQGEGWVNLLNPTINFR